MNLPASVFDLPELVAAGLEVIGGLASPHPTAAWFGLPAGAVPATGVELAARLILAATAAKSAAASPRLFPQEILAVVQLLGPLKLFLAASLSPLVLTGLLLDLHSRDGGPVGGGHHQEHAEHCR